MCGRRAGTGDGDPVAMTAFRSSSPAAAPSSQISSGFGELRGKPLHRRAHAGMEDHRRGLRVLHHDLDFGGRKPRVTGTTMAPALSTPQSATTSSMPFGR